MNRNRRVPTPADGANRPPHLCPDLLFMIDLAGDYHYTSITCPLGIASTTILVFPQSVATGCSKLGGARCETPNVAAYTYDIGEPQRLSVEMRHHVEQLIEQRYRELRRLQPKN